VFTMLVGQIAPPLHAMPLKPSLNGSKQYEGKEGESNPSNHAAVLSLSSSAPCHTALSADNALSGKTALSAKHAAVTSSLISADKRNHHGIMSALDSSEASDCCGADCQCPEGLCTVSIALIESRSSITFATTAGVVAHLSLGIPSTTIFFQYRPPKTTLS